MFNNKDAEFFGYVAALGGAYWILMGELNAPTWFMWLLVPLVGGYSARLSHIRGWLT